VQNDEVQQLNFLESVEEEKQEIVEEEKQQA